MVVAILTAWIPLPATAGDAATHCLWRISDWANHVYLQGSVHLLKTSNYPLPTPIEDAYRDSDVLVLEADLSAAQDPVQQLAMLQKGMLEGKATLKGTLSEETWAMAERQAEDMGVSMAMFNAFKPWYFSMAITMIRLQGLGFSAFDGLDWHFFNRAKEAGMPVIGLETLEYQMELFEAISADDQDALVRQTIKDIANIEEEMSEIMSAWATGDLVKLEQALLGSFKEYPLVYKCLVTDRNHNWVPMIMQFMDSGRVHMIVVGAGHLAGREGLVQLLAKKGLRLEQL
jgi:uncharacterized protein YbaP (TraB family)